MKNLSIRIDEKELNKFRTIAKHEGRSLNKQTLVLIRDFLNEFDKKQKNTKG